MAEFSSIVSFELDGADRPLRMEVLSAGDTIVSSVLPTNVLSTVSSLTGLSATVNDNSGVWSNASGASGWDSASATVLENSGAWGGSNPSAAGFEVWDETNTAVASTSSTWTSGFDYGISAWSTVKDTSSTWGVGGASAAGFEVWNETNTAVADTSSVWNQTNTDMASVSGNIATNTTVNTAQDKKLDDLVAASGGWDSTESTVDASSPAWGGTHTSVLLTSANISDNTDNIAVVGAVSANIATNTSLIEGIIDNVGPVSATISTNESNIATNTASISDNADNIAVIGAVSANIATNTNTNSLQTSQLTDVVNTSSVWDQTNTDMASVSGNIATNTASISDNADNIGVVGAVSANIASNTSLIEGVIDNVGPVSGDITTNTASISDNADNIGVVATASGGWDSTEATVTAGSSNWDTAFSTDLFPSSVGFDNWNKVYDQVLNTSNEGFLTGDSPTLSNALNANAQSINSLGGLLGNVALANFIVSADENLVLRAGKGSVNPTVSLSGTTIKFVQGAGGTFETSSFITSSQNWAGTFETVSTGSGGWGGGGSFEGSAVASSIVVTESSAVTVSGALAEVIENPPLQDWHLAFDISAGKAYWTWPQVVLNSEGSALTSNSAWNGVKGFDVGTGRLTGQNIVATTDVVTPTILVETNLSAGPDCTVQFDPSTITVGTMPYPAPYAYVQINVQNGSNSDNIYYFASGATKGIEEYDSNLIDWNSAESYFQISATGKYKFEMDSTFISAASGTTITFIMTKTTGLGGTETWKSIKDYHMVGDLATNCHMTYVGDVVAGENYTVRIDGDAAVQQGRGSTFMCTRVS